MYYVKTYKICLKLAHSEAGNDFARRLYVVARANSVVFLIVNKNLNQ